MENTFSARQFKEMKQFKKREQPLKDNERNLNSLEVTHFQLQFTDKFTKTLTNRTRIKENVKNEKQNTKNEKNDKSKNTKFKNKKILPFRQTYANKFNAIK